VSRKAIVVAGLSAIAIAASGCTGDSDAEAEGPPATTTEQVDISKFRAAIEESFGASGYETSWYGHVTGMKVGPHRTLEIATDVDPGDDETAGTICGAAMRFAYNSEAGDGLEGARVFGSDGMALSNCA
jgi:hypothetical protein